MRLDLRLQVGERLAQLVVALVALGGQVQRLLRRLGVGLRELLFPLGRGGVDGGLGLARGDVALLVARLDLLLELLLEGVARDRERRDGGQEALDFLGRRAARVLGVLELLERLVGLVLHVVDHGLLLRELLLQLLDRRVGRRLLLLLVVGHGLATALGALLGVPARARELVAPLLRLVLVGVHQVLNHRVGLAEELLAVVVHQGLLARGGARDDGVALVVDDGRQGHRARGQDGRRARVLGGVVAAASVGGEERGARRGLELAGGHGVGALLERVRGRGPLERELRVARGAGVHGVDAVDVAGAQHSLEARAGAHRHGRQHDGRPLALTRRRAHRTYPHQPRHGPVRNALKMAGLGGPV